MNKIKQTLQAGREEFKERTQVPRNSGHALDFYHIDKWLTSHQHTLLDAIAEEVEKLERYHSTDGGEAGMIASPDGDWIELKRLLTLLSEAKQQDV